jgi:hypothetical protein
MQDFSGNGRTGLLLSDAGALPKLTGDFLSLESSKKQYVAITNMGTAWGKLTDWSIHMTVNMVSTQAA